MSMKYFTNKVCNLLPLFGKELHTLMGRTSVDKIPINGWARGIFGSWLAQGGL